jgi:hypothetical protein
MTAKTSTTARTHATTGMLAVLGAAITGATWVGGEHGLAIALAGLDVLSFAGSCLWSRGTGNVAAIIRLSGDERQRLIDIRATATAGPGHDRLLPRRRHRQPRCRGHRQPMDVDLCRRRALLRCGGGCLPALSLS